MAARRPSLNPATHTGTTLSGRVRGGQQPVSGSTVQLWQVGTTGYGTGAAPLGSAATTGADGTFSITGNYSCANAAAGNSTLVYITATGGNPGLAAGTNNGALLLMAGLGACGDLTAATFTSINELTTVASVYALAQFMGPNGQIGSYGTSTTGLSNAFATLANLADVTSGTARTVTPQGNGLVPQAKLNTLANIISPCVNSAGASSASCATLFSTVAPTTTGAPSNVLASALQIALNPGYHVSPLLLLAPTFTPFQPTVSAANDWTVALSFASGGGAPAALAVDGSGSLWIANYGTGGSTSSVSRLSPTGVPASNSPFAGTSINGASGVAVDSLGNAWIANHDNNSAVALNVNASGTIQVATGPVQSVPAPSAAAMDRAGDVWFVSQSGNSLAELTAANLTGTPAIFSTLGLNQPSAIAFDASNNAWISNGSGTVTKFSPTASPVTSESFLGGGLSNPSAVAIDGLANVWVTDASLGQVAKLSTAGIPISSSSGFTGAGLTGASADAIDGGGNLWVADAKGNALSALSSSGAALSPATGYTGGGLSSPRALGIDASGNVWVANGAPVTAGSLVQTLTEFVGLAAPVNTPQAAAVQTATLAQRPGTPLPVANPSGPYTGTAGVAVAFTGSLSTAPTGQTLTYAWDFGDGSTGAGVSVTHAYGLGGQYTVTLRVTATDGASASAKVGAAISVAAPSIANFLPASGPVGTLVTVNGNNLAPPIGSATQVQLTQLGGGTILAPVSTVSPTSLTFVIPSGAASGAFSVTAGSQTATSPSALTVTASSSYALAVAPGSSTLIQGQSTALGVSITSTNSFSGTANLSVSGLPSGVTASFQPSAIGVGQVGLLTLTAPSGQPVGSATLTVTASATIDGLPAMQTAAANLNVTAPTTTFLGRTVVDDAAQEPVAGVTVSFLGVDDKGNSTGCSGSTLSDGGGNFVLSNLPAACVGPQLISYNGNTATAPAGKYAGVNLSYTLTSGKVTASPVLVHLPRIDNAETVMVQQNSATDQVFYLHTIPGVKATVYAGTTLSLDDGSQPNPFPLVAISIPLDRLPEQMPTTGMLMPFIVAFQPANAVASQPVAVNFPNSLGIAPNTSVMFVTLDPTHGYMVPYGTGTVSSDGSEFIADADPNHPGHAYGLVHFDWHGPASSPPPNINPAPPCGCGGGTAGDPVDLGSGLVSFTATDVQIGGRRGGLIINRTYRSQSSNSGPFGRGSSHNYAYQINTFPLLEGQGYVGLVMPDGNQYNFQQAADGSFFNASIPTLRGAIITGNITTGVFSLRWVDGSVWGFQIFTTLGSRVAFLTSMSDLNGNKTTLTINPSNPFQLLTATDPVGRSLTFTYDSTNRITQIVDPIGRKLTYAYNSAGALSTFTNANGGVTTYTYDGSINLATVTDPRGVVIEQNTYNESFDGRVSQQVQADGGIFKFAYTLQNPKDATSPVLQTVVTDPLGKQTTYRYDMQGFLQSVTDASGQIRTLTHDPTHFNLVSDYTGTGSCPVCGDTTKGDVHYTFDSLGNVASMTDALGDKTTMAYDTRFNKVNSVTDPVGNTTSAVYDANGNPTSIKDANGHKVQMAFDAFGEPIATTDGAGATTKIGYDAFGNISTVTDPLNASTYFTFDGLGRITQIQDALGRKGFTAYDALDRVVSVTDPLGNITKLSYDAVSDLLSVTDPKGAVTTFTYDARRRLVARTSPLGKTQTYVYDLDSNLTQFTDRRGQVTKSSYDVLNRLVKTVYTDSTVNRLYDSAGRLLEVDDTLDGSFTYKYDLSGRVLQQSGPTGVIRYTRDGLGRVAAEQVVGNNAVSYAYDPAGNMLSASMVGLGASYTYDVRNMPIGVSRSNGVNSTFSYDSTGQLLAIVHAKGATILDSQSYTYDLGGNRSAVGNDLSQSLTTLSSSRTSDAASELLTHRAITYTYDANGNRTSEVSSGATTTYSWDARNRLSSISSSTGMQTVLQYDYANNLLGLRKTVGGTTSTETFVVDSVNNVVALTDPSGVSSSVLTGRYLDSHIGSITSSGSVAFGLKDALGSVIATTDSMGNVGATQYYEPYGETAGSAPSQFPFSYAGRVQAQGNIYYNRARFYDAAAGVFISEDPMGLAAGANPFAYALGNPLAASDPSGYAPGDKWYGYNDRDFQGWFHRYWKRPGDADATKEEIEEAYEEWRNQGSPDRNGKCKDPKGDPERDDVDDENLFSEIGDWIGQHPGLVIGAGVVVVGGAILLTGGAAAPLVFAF